MKARVLFALTFAIATAADPLAGAADCPRFRGLAGDGVFVETGLLRRWPEGGPKLIWSVQGLGKGYSSAVVVDGTVYVTGMNDQQQGVLFAFDLDGSPQSTTVYGAEIGQTGPAPGGTRGTPTVDGDRVFIVTGLGSLVILDAAGPEVLETIDLLARFGAPEAQFGFAESVLANGQKVICTPGGSEAALVALDRTTGEVLWRTEGLDQATGYCSARLIGHQGRSLVLTMLANAVVAVDAGSGAVVWQHEYPHRAGVQPNPPLYVDGEVYVCSGMGAGGAMFSLDPNDPAAEAKWTDRTLDCQMHGTVVLDGCIYGTAQSGNRGLVCLDWETGRVRWNAPEVGMGALVAADGMLYIYGQDGTMHLVRPSAEAFEPAGRFSVPQGTNEHWAHPTIANGRLYIRHGDALMVYDVEAGS